MTLNQSVHQSIRRPFRCTCLISKCPLGMGKGIKPESIFFNETMVPCHKLRAWYILLCIHVTPESSTLNSTCECNVDNPKKCLHTPREYKWPCPFSTHATGDFLDIVHKTVHMYIALRGNMFCVIFL